ncbi:MAG: hypothetical protein HS132_08905 [Planctomycetia bacterium]|nr:hypothetical protein [Planctomycetia bacterium]
MKIIINHVLLFRGGCAGSDINNVAILCVHGSCYPYVRSKDIADRIPRMMNPRSS